MTARYTTFVPQDTHGPAIVAKFPADQEQGIPTNAVVRVLFDRQLFANIQTNSPTGLVLEADGAGR